MPNYLQEACRGAGRACGWIARLVALPVLLFAAGCDDSTSPDDRQVTVRTSFEQGLGEWSTHATDVMVGGEELEWSVVPSTDRASDGTTSVRFRAENRSDAAKLWIQRPLELRPNTRYRVSIEFAFATADRGAVNLWRIMAGALPSAPTTTADLEPTFRGETGSPSDDEGYDWLAKSYEVMVMTGADGRLFIVVGVWGTYEVTRTYYVDDVRVTAERVN